jgi:hypothetical protein
MKSRELIDAIGRLAFDRILVQRQQFETRAQSQTRQRRQSICIQLLIRIINKIKQQIDTR